MTPLRYRITEEDAVRAGMALYRRDRRPRMLRHVVLASVLVIGIASAMFGQDLRQALVIAATMGAVTALTVWLMLRWIERRKLPERIAAEFQTRTELHAEFEVSWDHEGLTFRMGDFEQSPRYTDLSHWTETDGTVSCYIGQEIAGVIPARAFESDEQRAALIGLLMQAGVERQ